jgi:hypothetical protein
LKNFCRLGKAGEISTNLKRLGGVLLDREGWRNIHKLKMLEGVLLARVKRMEK